MTASLTTFLGSLFLGFTLVILPIALALITVSQIDPIAREEKMFNKAKK